MTEGLLALAIVTTFVAYVLTLHYLTAMVNLIVQNVSTLNHTTSPTTMISPTDACALPALRGHKSSGALAGGGVVERQISVLVDAGEQDGLPLPQVPAPLDLAESAGSMRSSVGLQEAMVSLGKSTGDVFPANRIFMRCAKCKAPIARYEGYRHIRVGDHRTFCGSCHAAMGLPLDERRGGPAALGLS